MVITKYWLQPPYYTTHPWANFTPNSLYFLLRYPYIAPSLRTTNWLLICEFTSVCYIHQFVVLFRFQICDIIQYLSFSVQLMSLGIIPSKSIHVTANGKKKKKLWLSNILLYCKPHLYRFICGQTLRLLLYFEIVSNSAMNFGVHISFSISAFFKYTPRNIVSGSYGSYIFRFLQNLHTVLHSGCTNVHHTNSVQGFPFLHILANIYYLVFSFLFFSTIAILTGVK